MSDSIQVAVVGLGPIGLETARRLVRTPGLTLSAAADISPEIRGRSVSELVPGAQAAGTVLASLDEVLETQPRALILATGSRLAQLTPDLRRLARSGVATISSAEELSWPWRGPHASLARDLDLEAQKSQSRILGTGVNPGFVLDALPAFLTRISTDIRSVTGKRVVDSCQRRAGLRRKTGCGLSQDEFETRRDELGHVGLRESACIIAAALGSLKDATEELEPVIRDTPVETPDGVVKAGDVLGIRQRVELNDAGLEIRLELIIAAGQTSPGDTLEIDGQPRISLSLGGGLEGDGATAARLVGSVIPLLATSPGLKTVLDLPITGRRPE